MGCSANSSWTRCAFSGQARTVEIGVTPRSCPSYKTRAPGGSDWILTREGFAQQPVNMIPAVTIQIHPKRFMGAIILAYKRLLQFQGRGLSARWITAAIAVGSSN